MKFLLMFLSAIDAACTVFAYQNKAYGMGLWLSTLAALALIVSVKMEEKSDDEAR